MSRSRVDSTVYYRFIFADEDVSEGESQIEGHEDGTAGLLTTLTLELDQALRKTRIKEWVITLLWVPDDLPSQGTEKLVDKFYSWLFGKHPGKMVDGRDFIAIEVEVDKERGIVYLTQEAYWLDGSSAQVQEVLQGRKAETERDTVANGSSITKARKPEGAAREGKALAVPSARWYSCVPCTVHEVGYEAGIADASESHE